MNKKESAHDYSWLPGMDSNHDKQNQNLLCYHYTTGHFTGEGVEA